MYSGSILSVAIAAVFSQLLFLVSRAGLESIPADIE